MHNAYMCCPWTLSGKSQTDSDATDRNAAVAAGTDVTYLDRDAEVNLNSQSKCLNHSVVPLVKERNSTN